jgi:hypothetical protein
MRITISIILLILAISVVSVPAQALESFDEAKKEAVSRGKPILMEFLRPG